MFSAAEGKIEDVLKRLNLAEVVREQVDSFPIAKLEELVLGIISQGATSLITWLGGIIGGLSRGHSSNYRLFDELKRRK